MDARLVWDTWRRILTDDRLVARVLDPHDGQDDTGLSPEEIAIVDDYARTHAATETNIGMYRAGLVRNALAAMSLVPMSQQLLYTSGLDVELAAASYAQADSYRDHGPNFWRIAGGFVAHLAGEPAFSAPAHRDVLALDTATAALARRLANSPDAWSIPRVPRGYDGTVRIVASRTAIVIPSAHDLTEWIVHPESFDPTERLTATTHHWLVYFSEPEAERRYSELSERAARAFALLSVPRTVVDVALALDLDLAEVRQVIDSLASLGIVGAVPSFEVRHVSP